MAISSISGAARGGGPVEQERERHGLGELGRAAEAAEAAVELAAEAGDGLVEDRGRQRPATGTASAGSPTDGGALLDGLAELVGLFEELAPPGLPGVVDGVEQAHEAGHALAVVGREVRAAEERSALGVEEDRHRPAAAAGHGLHRLHVDRVDVGPLLAVHLHVDEPVVHHRGDGRVLERLVGHHVAPVARRVADREQDRLVLGPGPGERLLAPGVPVDRVVGVLAEVGAGLVGEAVGHHRCTVPAGSAGPSRPAKVNARSSFTGTSTRRPATTQTSRASPPRRSRSSGRSSRTDRRGHGCSRIPTRGGVHDRAAALPGPARRRCPASGPRHPGSTTAWPAPGPRPSAVARRRARSTASSPSVPTASSSS